MAQIDTLKAVLGNPDVDTDVLTFYLDSAENIILDLRNADYVEDRYLTTQIKMAVEMYNKEGAEGQLQHSENRISRVYTAGDISLDLINQVTPHVRTPFSTVRTSS